MEKALVWLSADLPITLSVVKYNTGAIRFYEKFGFTPTGKSVEVPNELTNGKVIPRIEIKKLPL